MSARLAALRDDDGQAVLAAERMLDQVVLAIGNLARSRAALQV